MPDADAASTDRRAEEDVARAGPAGVAAARAPCATPLKAARARLSRIPGKPALLGTIVRVLPPARGTGRRPCAAAAAARGRHDGVGLLAGTALDLSQPAASRAAGQAAN
jgi:hypothetical protein